MNWQEIPLPPGMRGAFEHHQIGGQSWLRHKETDTWFIPAQGGDGFFWEQSPFTPNSEELPADSFDKLGVAKSAPAIATDKPYKLHK